jgi:hypothetical protein
VGSTNPDSGTCAYCPSLLFNNVNGVCVLKQCTLRQRNDTARWVCGSGDCVYNGTGCGSQCLPNSAPDGKGICSDPSSACSQKIPLPVDINRCGEGCVYIGEENRCSNACQQFFVNDTNTGICVGLVCDERFPNTTLSFDYCGPDCVKVGDSSCGVTCPPSTILDPITKECRSEVSCSSHTYNVNETLKCGESCVYRRSVILQTQIMS